jgi:hypothetical protein
MSALVTDDVGNVAPDYGGFLQIPEPSMLEMLGDHGLFACFRAVQEIHLDLVGEVPPTAVYEELRASLVHMGWDICTGNGWLSASAHGCFPINGITGIIDEANGFQINDWGLLAAFEDAETLSCLNDAEIPVHAPWFPVEVLLDEGSFRRLVALRAS